MALNSLRRMTVFISFILYYSLVLVVSSPLCRLYGVICVNRMHYNNKYASNKLINGLSNIKNYIFTRSRYLSHSCLSIIIIIIIIITEYLVPHLQQAGPKRNYSFTRVDEELKAIKMSFLNTFKSRFYR